MPLVAPSPVAAPQATPQQAPAAGAPAQQPPGVQPAPGMPLPSSFPPPLSNVVSGQIPALRFPPEHPNFPASPIADFVAKNADALLKAGCDMAELPDKQTVIFNPVKTTKEAILAAYRKKELDKIPEVKSPQAPLKTASAKTRTVHKAPVTLSKPAVAAPAAGAALPLSGPQHAQQSSTPTPLAPVKTDKRALSARLEAVKGQNAPEETAPRTVVDRISSRAI